MQVGHWQVVIWGFVILFLFGPLIFRIVRTVLRNMSEEDGGEEPRPRRRRRRLADSHVHCPHCGEENAVKARYCNACGKPMDFVDV